ncbi:MAG: ROK family protein, partial [bacterium]|nr:ROK family protein [bacterium]
LSEHSQAIDVKEIAHLADYGDHSAKMVFHETGEILGRAIRAHAEQFDADCIVIGGQIARSIHLFESALRQSFGLNIPVMKAQHIDNSAVLGAAKLVFEGAQDD